ncbi:MAG: YceD family protein [Cellvibrionales bacterium]|nr:YceD family protein [Cellvibrionales bacterium]
MFEELLPTRAEFRKLAQKQAEFKKVLQVSHLPRIADVVYQGEGEVAIDLSFAFNEKYQVQVAGTISGQTTLICQRCLQPMPLTIDTEVKVIITTLEQADQIDRQFDPFISDGDVIDLNALVQEELLLAIPFVSYHDKSECQVSLSSNQQNALPDEVSNESKKNPFHVLSSLKKSNEE